MFEDSKFESDWMMYLGLEVAATTSQFFDRNRCVTQSTVLKSDCNNRRKQPSRSCHDSRSTEALILDAKP